MEINDLWIIALLDKKQLYRNEKKFPNFYYITKKLSKRVEKVIKINDSKFKTFRKMVSNKIKDKDKSNFTTKFILIGIL